MTLAEQIAEALKKGKQETTDTNTPVVEVIDSESLKTKSGSGK